MCSSIDKRTYDNSHLQLKLIADLKMQASKHNTLETSLDEQTKPFYAYHGVQLVGIGLPTKPELIMKLKTKLQGQIFDAGDSFEIFENEDTDSFEQSELDFDLFTRVQAKRDLKAFEDVFLIDHAFSFRYSELRKGIEQHAQLRDRLKNMLKFSGTKKNHPNFEIESDHNEIQISEFDGQEIEDPTTVEIPAGTVGLSFYSNNISDLEKVKQVLDKNPGVKVLWLNNNPISEDFSKLREFIEKYYPAIEILNSQFTSNLKEWGIKFGHLYPKISKFNSFNIKDVSHLNLNARNIFNLPNYDFFSEFKKVTSVSLKDHEIGDFLHMNKLIAFMKIIPNLKNIDVDKHLSDILWDLHKNKKLQEIAPNLISINRYHLDSGKPDDNEEDVKFICDNIWKIVGSYRLASAEKLDESSVWYVMDEFGSALQHSETPNSITAPFLYAPNNKLDNATISYSIMWITKDIAAGESISRDYLWGINESMGRIAKSLVWFNIPPRLFIDAYETRQAKAVKIYNEAKNMKLSHEESKKEETKNLPLKVGTDYIHIINTLNDPNFKLVKEIDDPDIVWVVQNVSQDWNLFKGRYINQFPFEACIVNKMHLANTVQAGFGNPPWMEPTYDLQNELEAFCGDFLKREEKNEDNLWIIKPPALARSLDMIVTDNLEIILRMLETGPRIAQKYITNTITLKKKKFDLRIVLSLSTNSKIDPPEIFLHKGVYARLANNPYTTDPRSLENFETHWTVMKYKGYNVEPINEEQFVNLFNAENKAKNISWKDIYPKIEELTREMFIAVLRTHPEMHMDNGRALYGIDLMFDENYQPKLLEFTFSPDCERIVKDYPSFFNDVFNCLFLNKENNVTRVL